MKLAISRFFFVPSHFKSARPTGFWGPSGALSKVNGHLNRLRLQDPLPEWIQAVEPVLLNHAEEFIALYEWQGGISTNALEVFCALPRPSLLFGNAADSLAEALRRAGCLHGIGSGTEGYGFSQIECAPDVVRKFKWRGRSLDFEVAERAIAYIAACALREMRWKYGRANASALSDDVFDPAREKWNGILLPLDAKAVKDMSPFRPPPAKGAALAR